jgi:hypothetical protein
MLITWKSLRPSIFFVQAQNSLIPNFPLSSQPTKNETQKLGFEGYRCRNGSAKLWSNTKFSRCSVCKSARYCCKECCTLACTHKVYIMIIYSDWLLHQNEGQTGEQFGEPDLVQTNKWRTRPFPHHSFWPIPCTPVSREAWAQLCAWMGELTSGFRSLLFRPSWLLSRAQQTKFKLFVKLSIWSNQQSELYLLRDGVYQLKGIDTLFTSPCPCLWTWG